MLKKWICAFAALGLLAGGSSAFAAKEIGITVMGKPLPTDSPPIDQQGRVLVPLRAVAEALGASVGWNQTTRTVSVSKWTQNISLTRGQQVAVIERQESQGTSKETINLGTTVQIIHNRVYVPLRFVSEQFGYKVGWADNTVSIQSPLDEKQRAALYGDDLAAARQAAMDAMFAGGHYEHAPLLTQHKTEDYDTEFLFPEGEALRFFTIEGDETVTYFEYRNDFLVATWQAHLDVNAGDSVGQLLGDKLADRTGPTPRIDKPFYYYLTGYMGDANWLECGQIGTDGTVEQTGMKHTVGGEVTDTSGTITLTLPNEVRQEAAAD